MYLYYLNQTENTTYESIQSCIVCAESEEDAKTMDPSCGPGPYSCVYKENQIHWNWAYTKKGIQCKLIGIPSSDIPRGVVMAESCHVFNPS